jgi:23S rRNA-/tRNA-specific pseudouridylate synthase
LSTTSDNSATPPALGFPPPLLGSEPLRLPVLTCTDDWLALAKPPGIAMREHPWNLDFPNLDSALNRQLQNQKPELLRLKATCFGSIYNLDPEFSGLALFGLNRPAIARLREQYGDGRIETRIHFLTREDGGAETRTIDAPLLPHNTKPKMIPSTAKGKKCATHFTRLATAGAWSLWEARTGFSRPHQLRAHAALAGIPLMGDVRYDGPPSPSPNDLGLERRRNAAATKPLFHGLAAHLHTLQLPAEQAPLLAPRSRRLDACLRRLGLQAD